MQLNIDTRLQLGDFSADYQLQTSSDAIGLFGRSGAGKSTLLHLISGLQRPASGKITLNGRVLCDTGRDLFVPASKRNIGVVFQDSRLFPHLTVQKNLLFSRRGRTSKLEFNKIIDILKLDKLLKRRPTALSGGEKQRVAIGRALLSTPELLLLDEPFSAIDINMRGELLEFLSILRAEFSLPVMTISHDLPELLALSKELIVIEDGVISGQGRATDLLFAEDTPEILHNAEIHSTIETVVEKNDPTEGLTYLCAINTAEMKQSSMTIRAPYTTQFTVGSPVTVHLRPQDIIISKAPVEYITAQNQHQGRVTKIKELSWGRLAHIDIDGVGIISEITLKSSADFSIQLGDSLWVLFKSGAINTYSSTLDISDLKYLQQPVSRRYTASTRSRPARRSLQPQK